MSFTLIDPGTHWAKGRQRGHGGSRICAQGGVLRRVTFLLLENNREKHDPHILHIMTIYVQGEKGEPGVILGPDGQPMYLGGLAGKPVKTSVEHLFLLLLLHPSALCEAYV